MKAETLAKYEGPVPVILGGFINALGIARSFGKVGIPTICLDTTKNLAFHSKYVYGVQTCGPVESEVTFIENLVALVQMFKLKKKPILFATNDEWLISINKHRKQLEEYYTFPMDTWEKLNRCLDKRELYRLAEKLGVPIPEVLFEGQINKIPNGIRFPAILKPVDYYSFKEAMGKKVIVLKNDLDLQELKFKAVDKGLSKAEVVIQEVIPGGVENLYTITSYSNPKGVLKAYSIGHKIRQNPPDGGTIQCGKVEYDKDVYKYGKKLLEGMKYYGLANTEFKKDPAGNFKLIELNPRLGVWNYSVLKSGVNMPYMAYKECIGERAKGMEATTNGKIWIELLPDMLNSLFLFKKHGYIENAMTPRQWLRSIKGKKIFAVISLSDPMPFLWQVRSMAKKVCR